MAEQDTVVLVHGTWHASWCWDTVIPHLESGGRRVEAVDLPGRDDPAGVAAFGLDEFTDLVVATVRGAGGPVTLVGASMGGVTASRVAEEIPDLIAGLLYVAAFVPTDGQTFGDLLGVPEFAASLAFRQVMDPVAGTTTYPVEHARECFYGEAADDVARDCAQRLVPDTLAIASQPVRQSADGVGRVRRGYVECLRDRAVPLAAQRRMYRAAGIDRVFTLDTDHSPFLSRPKEFAAVLDTFTATNPQG